MEGPIQLAEIRLQDLYLHRPGSSPPSLLKRSIIYRSKYIFPKPFLK